MTTQQISYESDHSFADIEAVKRLAVEEQLRRSTDEHGEQHKRKNAYLVSAMLEASVRPGWFMHGSAYVSTILKAARETKNELAISALHARERVSILGQQGVETANDIKHSLEVAGTKTVETAQDVKAKSIGAAQNARRTLQRSASDLGKKSKDTIHEAQALVQQQMESAQEAAVEVKNNIQTSAREGATRVQGLVRSLSHSVLEKVNSAWVQLTSSSVSAYLILEEERERLYRIESDAQGYAISNAFQTASLIKQLAPEFYRPVSEPSTWYFTHLLEEGERARRVKQDLFDKTSSNNASALSKLVPQHVVSRPLPMAKPEIVEPIQVARPLVATM